jgi:hypothetical protein
MNLQTIQDVLKEKFKRWSYLEDYDMLIRMIIDNYVIIYNNGDNKNKDIEDYDEYYLSFV